MRQELLRHTDPIVGKYKLELPLVFYDRGQLPQPQADRPPLRGVFDGVRQHVHKNLL